MSRLFLLLVFPFFFACSAKRIDIEQTGSIIHNGRIINQSGEGRLAWPIGKSIVVSDYGWRSRGFHDGIDFAADTGAPVFSAHDGTVILSNSKMSSYGKTIIIKSINGIYTLYAHNSELLVEKSQVVKRGDLIARVGESGNATGPHLHFEVRVFNKDSKLISLDPMPILLPGNNRVKYRINQGLLEILASSQKEND
jgi:murein DD-endopeptidase MepM/ murein hydrolase activator NlpD